MAIIERSSGLRAAAALLLLALVLAAYWQAPRNGFHLDDEANIREQAPVRMTELSGAGLARAWNESLHPWRKIPNVSFALDFWRGGGEPRAFQQTNVALHFAAALAVFALLVSVLPRSRAATLAALAAAALWALHPIQVQAVTYIVQRMAEFAALFTLISVWAYVRARQEPSRAGRWFAAALAAFAAGLLSKENAAIIPALWWLAEYSVCRPQGPLLRGRLDRAVFALPFLLLALATIDLASGRGPLSDFVLPGYQGRNFSFEERLLTQPRVIAFHLSQLVWPLPGRFALEHDFPLSRGLLDPPATLAALAALAAWIGMGIATIMRPQWRVSGFFLLWVPATLAIESSVLAMEMVFEHRMYLPAVGLAGLAALVLRRAFEADRPARWAAAALVALLCIGLVAATQQRVAVWSSRLALQADAVDKAPNSGRAWMAYGEALLEAGRQGEAQQALERAVALDTRMWGAYEKLGVILLDREQPAEAERLLRQALAISGGHHTVWNHLGEAVLRQGRAREAREPLARAVAAAPWQAEYRWNLALALEQGGDCAGALAQWQEYLRLDGGREDRLQVERHIEENWRRPGAACAGTDSQKHGK